MSVSFGHVCKKNLKLPFLIPKFGNFPLCTKKKEKYGRLPLAVPIWSVMNVMSPQIPQFRWEFRKPKASYTHVWQEPDKFSCKLNCAAKASGASYHREMCTIVTNNPNRSADQPAINVQMCHKDTHSTYIVCYKPFILQPFTLFAKYGCVGVETKKVYFISRLCHGYILWGKCIRHVNWSI